MQPSKQPPYPPVFTPGDLVEVMGVEFPPNSGKIKSWLGLFQEVGFPASTAGLPVNQIGKVLDERLVGTVKNGEWCLVVASRYCETDAKWYYLLRGLGFKKSFGWTRTAIRLKLVEKSVP